MKKRPIPHRGNFLSYILKQKKKIIFGSIATISLAISETMTGAFFKIITQFLSKLSQKINTMPLDSLRIPVKLYLPVPFVKMQVPLVRVKLVGYDLLIKGIAVLCLIYVFICLIKSLSRYFREIFMNHAMYKILQDFKQDIYSKLLDLTAAFFNTNKTGDLISRITFDVTMLQEIMNLFMEFSRAAIYMLIILPVLFYLQWKLTLFVLFFFPPAYVILHLVNSRIRGVSKTITDNVGDYTAFLEDTLNGYRLVKSHNMADEESERFNRLVEYNFQQNYKNIKFLNLLNPSIEFMSACGISIIIFYLGYALLHQQTTLGNMVFYLYLVQSVYKPIKKAGKAFGQYQVLTVSSKKIFRLLNEVPVNNMQLMGEVKLPQEIDTIQFQDITFGYNGSGKVLEKVTITARKNRILVLTGESGRGKTTLLNLLSGLYSAETGTIEINGIPLDQIGYKALSDLIAMASQEKYIFSGSIRHNLYYGIKNSPGNIPQELSRWKEYFFSQGKIDQGAGGLSEREKQKLTILRAFLKGSPLLVLDEPTSDIDDASRKDLYAALKGGVSGKIVIIATHDERLIELADDVYRL